jgi:hypothetical protein
MDCVNRAHKNFQIEHEKVFGDPKTQCRPGATSGKKMNRDNMDNDIDFVCVQGS